VPVVLALTAATSAAEGEDTCGSAPNPIVCENALPGDPAKNWQVEGVGDPTIQGYATSMSVDVGQTEDFKIDTTASAYHIEILRLGYYGGDGARVVASNIQPTAQLPQVQPECLHEASTGLIDCGNWGVSAQWTVPSNAVSGVYIAELTRNDTGGKSQIVFVVRNDASHSKILLQTSDATWEAYNEYGGNSLYTCTVDCPPGNPKAYKGAYAVSYNRPDSGAFVTDDGASYLWYAEYQMMRFLEKNGYNISYTTEGEVDRDGALLKNHKIFMSSGHDEYWSAGQRANVEAAREAGVSLAFFSANELFWKTRWGPSTEGTETPYRTLTTYKETHFEGPVDPEDPPTWTGAWRDPRVPEADGGKPENALSGQQFEVNSGTSEITVPAQYSKLRLWRNTAVARLQPGQTLTLAPGVGTLGYEWDEDVDNGFRPAGEFDLSSTTVGELQSFIDYGSTLNYDATGTHHLTLYRAASGALVFGAGTVQWSWGLENADAWEEPNTDPGRHPPDPNMEQFTVNLLSEMGAQPETLIAGLVTPTPSTNTTPPSSTITSPAQGATVQDGSKVTISGTATDSGGGVVAGVEVSTDNGKTWHPATLTTPDEQSVNWTYTWAAHGYPSTTIKSRAVDDSTNLETPSAGVKVNVSCPCSIWGNAVTPPEPDSGDSHSVELGVKFTSEAPGTVTGVRFYKSAANTGTHIGNLWSTSGERLGTATFTNETETGWQQVSFSTPVEISPNTTYIASYFAPSGHYAASQYYFYTPPPTGGNILNSPPLHAVSAAAPPANGSYVSANGVYSYSSSSTFPTSSFEGTNYWVEPVFEPSSPTSPGQVTDVSATAGDLSATVSWSAPSSGGQVASYTITPYVGGVAQPATTITGSPPATSAAITGLTNGTSYTFTVTATNAIGAGPASEPSNAVTPDSLTAPAAPTGVTATAANASAVLTWSAPSNGGSPITSYTITPYIGGAPQPTSTVSGSPPATGTTVTGLTNGTSYTFTVTATNAIGAGPASEPSNAVTPATITAPSAPTGVSASAATDQALVSWSAPSNNGGSPIASYTIIPYVGAAAQTPTTVSASSTSTIVKGLSNGAPYTFTVTAANAAGSGPPSSASTAVTPQDTIFDFASPATVDSGDTHSTVVGVQFSSEVAGSVTGIRFYKATTNTGTHIGSLWSATGTLLEAATFTSETASGWQQVNFSTPVPINAKTTYVAAYLAPKGHYSDTSSEFATAGFSNLPLSALANSISVNGVYAYSTGDVFPTSTYKATNYWVDVDFEPSQTATAPGPVSNVSATAGDGSATVTWSAPSSGGAVTAYKVTPYLGSTAQPASTVSGSPPARSATIAGLTGGDSYTFTVQASNGNGSGPVSPQSNAVTPLTAPSAPAGVTASAGNGSASVSWTAPANGGSPITSYTITPYVGATAQPTTTVSGSPPATGTTVTGLTNGTAYTFTVTATNAIGSSAASEASKAVTPATVTAPSAPTGVTASAGNGSAAVTWTAPTNGGSPITSYTVTPYIGSTAQPTTTVSGSPPAAGATVTGLTNGTAYTFTVTATNAIGVGPASEPSQAITPFTTPSAATAVAASAANGSATVTWTAPSNGGSPITSYTITPYIGATAQPTTTITGNPPATSTTVTGLTNGTAYTFTVTATNAAGSGPASEHSNTATPATAPSAPTGVSASAGSGSATVAWTAPANGGSPITSYTITPYIGTTAQATTTVSGSPPATSATITGLTNGSSYTFTVTATNAAGSGPASEHSNTATPVTTPSAPSGVAASAASGSATVTWTAPSNGGSPITSYTVTPYIGSTAQPTTTITGNPPATSTTITGLTNGSSYTFTVTATNAIGSGGASEHSNTVTPSAGAIAIDANVTVNGHSTATTPSFSTVEGGEQLLALVGSDGPAGAGKQTVTVSGAGLTWTLVQRASSRSGDAEIWAATTSKALAGVTVSSTPALSGYDQTLTVISIQRSAGVGASVIGGGASGAPSVSLVSTEEGSLGFAVGNDWDAATARTLGAGQVMLHQYLDTKTGDTYWSQYTGQPAGPTGSVVTLNDTAPTSDQWNMAAVEILRKATLPGGIG
jgi:Domain of unknown function (DUF4082)/Fibronectin type III domain/Bacterial Ig domain